MQRARRLPRHRALSGPAGRKGGRAGNRQGLAAQAPGGTAIHAKPFSDTAETGAACSASLAQGESRDAAGLEADFRVFGQALVSRSADKSPARLANPAGAACRGRSATRLGVGAVRADQEAVSSPVLRVRAPRRLLPFLPRVLPSSAAAPLTLSSTVPVAREASVPAAVSACRPPPMLSWRSHRPRPRPHPCPPRPQSRRHPPRRRRRRSRHRQLLPAPVPSQHGRGSIEDLGQDFTSELRAQKRPKAAGPTLRPTLRLSLSARSRPSRGRLRAAGLARRRGLCRTSGRLYGFGCGSFRGGSSLRASRT